MKKIGLVLAVAAFAACGSVPDEETTGPTQPGGKADTFDPSSGEVPTYEQFRDSLYCEPDDGPCIVQGDIPIWGEEALQQYYSSSLGLVNGLTVMTESSVDAIWDRIERFDLTYCVSDDFGDDKNYVLEALDGAIAEWEAIAHVGFKYLSEHDAKCDASNNRLKFNVSPSTDPWAGYLARAFFPNYERSKRELLINMPSHKNFKADQEEYTLQGVLRHELGHVLGFRHEHIRDEASAYYCYEDKQYRTITEYDSASVMHYPQCGGTNDWSLQLTDIDRRGAAFFYPDFDAYTAARCDVELDADGILNDDCEPVVHQMLELANTASFEVLDDWVRLDRRAVEQMVDRRSSHPFNTMDELREISYFKTVGIQKMYHYLYTDGRCELEQEESGMVNAQCRPVVNRILELANNASQEELDFDVALDRRAAANIVVIREERPFTALEELWAVDYVKTQAINKMYRFIYGE